MMLYKPLVSLLMVFAAASSVAASATPVRRGGIYPPPPAPTIAPEQCTTQQQCCNTVTSSSDPVLGLLTTLFKVDPNLIVGLNCVGIVGGAKCQANTLCCQNVQQNGPINFNCNPINLALL